MFKSLIAVALCSVCCSAYFPLDTVYGGIGNTYDNIYGGYENIYDNVYDQEYCNELTCPNPLYNNIFTRGGIYNDIYDTEFNTFGNTFGGYGLGGVSDYKKRCKRSIRCQEKVDTLTNIGAQKVCTKTLGLGLRSKIFEAEECCKIGALVGRTVGPQYRDVCVQGGRKLQYKTEQCTRDFTRTCKKAFINCCRKEKESIQGFGGVFGGYGYDTEYLY